MKAFIAWSGGKDCMLALHRIKKEGLHQVHSLVNMCSANGEHSGSHGINSQLIKEQSRAINIPIIQQAVDDKGYEYNLKKVITELKSQGVNAGVFGDIYLQAHRDWIDRVCNEMDITPLFPLWLNNTDELLKEFIDNGYKTLVVSVNADLLSKEWLSRELNNDFLAEIKRLPNIDACAENGEYHSFVFDGPLFQESLKLMKGEIRFEHNHWLLNVNNTQHD